MRELSNLSNQQISSMNTALENISAINISQENIKNFDKNISSLGGRLGNLIANASEAETKLAQFATSTSAVSSVLASSGKIIENTETTAENLERLQTELQDVLSSANNEKNKLASAVAEISREIKQAKAVITKTSDLSLQMEKTIEERMASILKLVRNG
jgi:ABC-type transporter Mla subunit MlaD